MGDTAASARWWVQEQTTLESGAVRTVVRDANGRTHTVTVPRRQATAAGIVEAIEAAIDHAPLRRDDVP